MFKIKREKPKHRRSGQPRVILCEYKYNKIVRFQRFNHEPNVDEFLNFVNGFTGTKKQRSQDQIPIHLL